MSTKAAHQRATAKYNKEKTTQLNIRLNNGTDADIIQYMQGIDNIAGYIKSLIRADIAKK